MKDKGHVVISTVCVNIIPKLSINDALVREWRKFTEEDASY